MRAFPAGPRKTVHNITESRTLGAFEMRLLFLDLRRQPGENRLTCVKALLFLHPGTLEGDISDARVRRSGKDIQQI